MITQKEIVEEIAKHLTIATQDVDLNAGLTDDLGLSPVEIADLLSELAEKFNINFDPLETENIRTVNDLVVMIEDLSLE